MKDLCCDKCTENVIDLDSINVNTIPVVIIGPQFCQMHRGTYSWKTLVDFNYANLAKRRQNKSKNSEGHH